MSNNIKIYILKIYLYIYMVVKIECNTSIKLNILKYSCIYFYNFVNNKINSLENLIVRKANPNK